MHRTLRRPSKRPQLIVDQRNRSLADPVPVRVGRQGPFGRERVVSALPLTETPNQWLRPHSVVHDQRSNYIADPQTYLIGNPPLGVWVSRLLTARWVEDTRRLAG
jgi:hypothetical protein